MSENEDEPKPQLQDPDDYHRRERLKEIHKRRQQVAGVLDEIDGFTEFEIHENQKANLAHAVTAYIAELEPLIATSDYEFDLPDSLAWDSPSHYADLMGSKPDHETKTTEVANYMESVRMYRELNHFLAEVKPLIEPDENNEWEV